LKSDLDGEVYDLRGLNCPMPVLKTRKRLSGMKPGEQLIIETTDSLAVIDIPHFCQENGHRLVAYGPVEGGHRFTIERA
jgi:tRNA 2-thiouridine synthesizing protein A